MCSSNRDWALNCEGPLRLCSQHNQNSRLQYSYGWTNAFQQADGSQGTCTINTPLAQDKLIIPTRERVAVGVEPSFNLKTMPALTLLLRKCKPCCWWTKQGKWCSVNWWAWTATQRTSSVTLLQVSKVISTTENRNQQAPSSRMSGLSPSYKISTAIFIAQWRSHSELWFSAGFW